jgi:phosphotriesterase-related protein
MREFPFFILVIFCFSISCKPQEFKLITVNGEIPVEEMGICLIHEHILVDFIGADSTGYHRWEKSEVIERALPILLKDKQKGVKTFFECTPAYLGRDPLLLKELSEKTAGRA